MAACKQAQAPRLLRTTRSGDPCSPGGVMTEVLPRGMVDGMYTRRRDTRMKGSRGPAWIRWCAWASFLVALPTAVWRVLPGFGIPLGTPVAWREFQELPGAGTSYVLGLSLMQLAAAACCLLFAVDVRRFVPGLLPERLRRCVPVLVGVAGMIGAVVLILLIVMSIIAWDKVDPFAGEPYDGWAWLSLVCYLLAALWPVFLVPASLGHLARHRSPRRPATVRVALE